MISRADSYAEFDAIKENINTTCRVTIMCVRLMMAQSSNFNYPLHGQFCVLEAFKTYIAHSHELNKLVNTLILLTLTITIKHVERVLIMGTIQIYLDNTFDSVIFEQKILHYTVLCLIFIINLNFRMNLEKGFFHLKILAARNAIIVCVTITAPVYFET